MNQMRWIRKTTIQHAFLVLIGLIVTTPAFAAGVVVHDQEEYGNAVRNAQPGDVIQLANGVWKDFEIVFTGKAPPRKQLAEFVHANRFGQPFRR